MRRVCVYGASTCRFKCEGVRACVCVREFLHSCMSSFVLNALIRMYTRPKNKRDGKERGSSPASALARNSVRSAYVQVCLCLRVFVFVRACVSGCVRRACGVGISCATVDLLIARAWRNTHTNACARARAHAHTHTQGNGSLPIQFWDETFALSPRTFGRTHQVFFLIIIL